jgi:putative nucleotidyltransferase with HDIG domain
MSDPVRFLTVFAHALTSITLYPEGHPTRETACEGAYQELEGLTASGNARTFTFIESEVVYGREPLRDLKRWEWGQRLSAAGIQRLEFERRISRDQFDGFLHEILARLTLSAVDTSDQRQMRDLGVRFGAVGMQGLSDPEASSPAVATLQVGLTEEADTLRWMQQEVNRLGIVPLPEAEAIVGSLTVAMHGDRRVLLPLLQLKEFDQYTTTHSLNVSVLSMGLAEGLGCGPAEVRAFGIAGLLHDIGKVRIPIEVLTKPGALTPDERRLMNEHPADGARIILQSEEDLDLAAIVAYEHHIMLNGGGYPALHYRRECALASRLVHVCDVYDALCTKRPYRDAWTPERAAAYLEERTGSEFDPDIVSAFLRLLRKSDVEVRILAA